MNICVVGIGYWGPNLVRNFLSNPSVDKVYCYDLNRNKLEEIKNKFPMIEIEPEYNKILDNDTIDAIAIATPIQSHYSLAKRALTADKHILIEKPMTSSSNEAQELIQIARNRNLTLMVDHTFIYTSAVNAMKKIIDEGQIGNILYFDSVRINLGLFQTDINVIWDLAPHDLSIMIHLMKERPISVMANAIAHYNKKIEDVAYLALFFQNNIIAHFHLSWLSPVKVRNIIIGGDKKMITYNDVESNEKVKVYDKGVKTISKDDEIYHMLVQYRTGDIHVPALENKEALATEVQHFVDCIKTKKQPLTSGEDGLWVVKILEASQASLKKGKRINL